MSITYNLTYKEAFKITFVERFRLTFKQYCCSSLFLRWVKLSRKLAGNTLFPERVVRNVGRCVLVGAAAMISSSACVATMAWLTLVSDDDESWV